MLILFTLVELVFSYTHIGVFQSNILDSFNIESSGFGPFRFHYENNRISSSDWMDQSDGISLTLSPNTSQSHIDLWKFIIQLFDNIPQQTKHYNIELSECPKPLYLDKSKFINQCSSSNHLQSSDYINGTNYKDIIKSKITESDFGKSPAFGFQKSCFHDYTLQPWLSASEFGNLKDKNPNNYFKLILLPKLFQVRYSFKTRLINFILQEFNNSLIINDLYWFDIQYDGSDLTLGFMSNFDAKSSEILKKFTFLTQNLEIINHFTDGKRGYLDEAITGIGSHKELTVKLSHSFSNKAIRIIHYLDNSFFVDPAEVMKMANTQLQLKNCTRNSDTQFDNISVTKNNIENPFKESSVQIIEITICPQNNKIEYSLPIHARYMPICRLDKCTGYEYSLITIPSVYYSTDIAEDIKVIDNFQLAKLLQLTYEVSFMRFMSKTLIGSYISNITTKTYWSKMKIVKNPDMVYGNNSINMPARSSPNRVEFDEDRGIIYIVSSLTCGRESLHLPTFIITLITPLILTALTIALVMIGSNNSIAVVGKILATSRLAKRIMYNSKVD